MRLHPEEKTRLVALAYFFAFVIALATVLNIYSYVRDSGGIEVEAQGNRGKNTLGISDYQSEQND